MRMYDLHTQIRLPRPLDEVFRFFSNPHNLEILTPKWLHFHVLTPKSIPIRQGAKIDYKLRFRGIPLRWQSEITSWRPPFGFTDEQRKGPYRQWIHEHTFEEVDGMSVVGDHVRYAILGGSFINHLFVKKDVEKIFRFRENQLRKLFDAPRCRSRLIMDEPSGETRQTEKSIDESA